MTHETDTLDHQGPGRFGGEPAVRATTSTGERVGAGFALLALVIGVPVLLALLGGSRPLPTGLPDRHDLTQPLSFDTVLAVLLAVVWLAWLFFVVCVVVEIGAARRGGLAPPVPLGGPVQRLARVLVGALLLAGVVSGPAATAATAASTDASPQGPVASAQQSPSADRADHAGYADHADGGGEAGSRSTTRQEITTREHLAGHLVYTVAAPVNGYHDNLWDIAARHLGDGRRYREIYELNKGLLQPDGRRLELARLIQPGWHLVMPDDATGVSRFEAPATPEAPAQDQTPHQGPATQGAGDTAATGAADDGGSVLPGGPVGTGLVAATALAALALERRRRIGGPAGAAAEVEAELRGFATPTRAAFLDRALRDLAASCRATGAALPAIYAVRLDDRTVTLQLAPANPTPVGAWHTGDAGTTWTRDFIEPEDGAGSEVCPYPGLVSLGVDTTGADVLVDLEAAGGLVAVEGDPVVSSEVAAAIALQAGTAAWASTVRVTATGLPDGLDAVSAERLQVVTDLTTTVEELERNVAAIRADVLTGRITRRTPVPSWLVVAGAQLDAGTTDRLVTLAGPGRQALSVVLTGSHPTARWTMRVDRAGSLTVPELGVSVTANRIGAGQLEGLAALFVAAREPDRPDDGGRSAIPPPARAVDDASWSTAPRRVGVLGPVVVTGAAEIDPTRAAQATEIVLYLALHPGGVHPKVLEGVLWPRGGTGDVTAAAVERAREWLGSDLHGRAHLREDADGRLSLGEEVVCDWDAARSLLIRSRRATGRTEEAELLRRGLQLVRGSCFAEVPEGRYGWLAHDDLERTVRRVLVDAAHRLAVLSDDDPDGACTAALAGLRADSANQLLWRDLLRARHAQNGAAGVRQTLDGMGEPLRGIPLEAETEALVEEYLPGPGESSAG